MASVRSTVEASSRLGIGQLTLYCLSSENWKRPQLELDFLMHLLEQYMIEERSTNMEQNIVVRIIGRRDGIPDRVLAEMDKTIVMSSTNKSPGYDLPNENEMLKLPSLGIFQICVDGDRLGIVGERGELVIQTGNELLKGIA